MLASSLAEMHPARPGFGCIKFRKATVSTSPVTGEQLYFEVAR
jgi:hypothetical protein